MDANLIKFIIGALSLIFVARYILSLGKSQETKKTGRALPLILGSISGFAAFIAHAGGPPIKGLLLQQKLEKSEFVGTNGMFIFFMNVLKMFIYSGMGQLTTASLKTSLVLSPMLFIGIVAGTYLHKIVDPKLFIKLVHVFLFAAGLKLLWDSAPSIVMLF